MIQDIQTALIDGISVEINGERNLLELIRKAGIEVPTFCYHSELSIYGACRMCIVDVEGQGIVGSCSTPCLPGMVVRTNTEEIREIRRIAVELLLANHEQSCPTCPRSSSCKLQELAGNLGVDQVRFKATQPEQAVDRSSPGIVRDPNKCILCGDCVRACSEIQGIGAIDFAYRGADVTVLPAFGKELAEVDCVHCGQCARVCPTGALSVKSDTRAVWKELDDSQKTVVAQIAPAVRVALGEEFGLAPGEIATGQIVSALRRLGFDKVYDTSFAADLTVLEEAEEFIGRLESRENLPQFTSCCPAWVQYAEQSCSDLIENLSSCKSPQQMFGSVAREVLPGMLDVRQDDLVVVSIMPCVAKKGEAAHDAFETDGNPDVNHVLTTQELAHMIREAGICFHELAPDSVDLPLGFKTGAGVIFGSSGGVSEAVLRYAVEKVTGTHLESVDFLETRGEEGLREVEIPLGEGHVRMAIVHGLRNAREVVRRIRQGETEYDIVEVMACPGGCVNGAGQPVSSEPQARQKRAQGLYAADKMAQLHKSQDNHMLHKCCGGCSAGTGAENTHQLLHRDYSKRRRIDGVLLPLFGDGGEEKLPVRVCVGTHCHTKGSQKILQELLSFAESNHLHDQIDVQATFCFENCGKGPNVKVGDTLISECTPSSAVDVVVNELSKLVQKHE